MTDAGRHAGEPPAWTAPEARPADPASPDHGAGGAQAPSPAETVHELTTAEVAAQAPLREMAHAFRVNAEALHGLQQMQAELARSLRRGDRSELMLQNTQVLNETFRNLASIQRELLTRLDRGGGGGRRGPLIPLMLLGLLLALLGGVWVLLDAIERKPDGPAIDPLMLARRESDSRKEGRREGLMQGEREVQLLKDALDDAVARQKTLQQQLDEKNLGLDEAQRSRRAAEVERDDLASRVRRAQQDALTRRVLEDEVRGLTSKLAIADQEVERAMHDMARKARDNVRLRRRMADYGFDLPPDPRLPGSGASSDAEPPEAGDAAWTGSDEAPSGGFPEPEAAPKEEESRPDRASTSAPTVGPGEDRPPALPPAATGGPEENASSDGSPHLPPPIVRPDRALSRDPKVLGQIRERLNRLLDQSSPAGQDAWHVTRIDGVSHTRLAGVIVLHYDPRGRLIDSIEARDMRVQHDRKRRVVELVFRDGARVAPSNRAPLPETGLSIRVAEGDAVQPWTSSGLSFLQRR